MKRILLFLLPILLLLGYFLISDQSGWSTNEYGTCYLNRSGQPVSGWQNIDNISYYFNSETYALHTGDPGTDARCTAADRGLCAEE